MNETYMKRTRLLEIEQGKHCTRLMWMESLIWVTFGLLLAGTTSAIVSLLIKM